MVERREAGNSQGKPRAGQIGIDGGTSARRESESAVPLAQAVLERQFVSSERRRGSRPGFGTERRARTNQGTAAAARQEDHGEVDSQGSR